MHVLLLFSIKCKHDYYVLHIDIISINFGEYLFGPQIFSFDLSNRSQLILDSPLDYETATNYSFTIEATEVFTTNNTEPFTSTATVIVHILPVNEHPPVITPSTRLA